MMWRGEAKQAFGEPLETIAVAVAAAVLLLLPLFEVGADPVAGIVGALVGLAMGAVAARRFDASGRPSSRPPARLPGRRAGYVQPVSGARFSEAELEEAVSRLTDGTRLRAAEARVAAAAPALQRVLAGGPRRRRLVRRIAPGGARAGRRYDPDERATAVDVLLAEETRISMMVGVAVGWALADELGPPTITNDEEES